MKNPLRTVLLFLVFIAIENPLFSQSQFSLSRQIEVTPTLEKEDIALKISKETREVYLKIDCEIYDGDINITILDPQGKEQGNFSVESHFSEKDNKNQSGNSLIFHGLSEIVSGRIEKSFKQPIEGEWKIIIVAQKASGKITIESQEYKN